MQQQQLPLNENPEILSDEEEINKLSEEVKTDWKKFRVNRRNVGLTYPRSQLEKDDIVKYFGDKEGFGNKPIQMVVAKEHHADGQGWHFHVFLEWDEKIDIKNPKKFDINGEHPNIRKVTNKQGWLKYITKEDPAPLCLGITLAEYLKEKTSPRALLLKDLVLDEISWREAIEQNWNLVWDLDKIYRNVILAKSIMKEQKVQEYIPRATNKQRHFWIFGETNTGKTSVLRNLQNANPDWWFQMPTNDDWVGYHNHPYLWLDEFNGQIAIQQLNRICDGGAKVNTKGSSTEICKYPIVIICSNYSIRSTYHNASDNIVKTVQSRFKEIETNIEGWETPLIEFFAFKPMAAPREEPKKPQVQILEEPLPEILFEAARGEADQNN